MMCNIGIEMKFVVLLLLGVFVWGDEEVRCIEREREALVSFKNGLIDAFGILSSWRSDECCNWYGVVCSNTTDGHVIRLELGGADRNDFDTGLVGNVSSSLLELHHLNYLDLSGNDFGGNPIPEFIYSMKQLQHLDLWNSHFYGVVPPQIGNLTNLRSLDLSYNSLSCANLDWLSSLSLLSFLDLSSFDLSHTNWLQHILPLHSLDELHLKSCNIKDVKPSASIFPNSSSSSLSSLDLSDNHLTPSAFDWLSNVSSSLVKIDLSRNTLGSLIPNAFERLTHLEHLDLSSNMLEGEMPKSLGNLSHLRVLVLYNNELRGELNEFIVNLSSKGLEMFDLARNQLTGSVPDLRPFSALTELYLGNNKLRGTLPVSLGQLSKLQVLDVSHNSLEGTLSESHFITLHKLKIVDLSLTSVKLHTASNWSPPFQMESILLAGCDVGPSFPKWFRTQRNLTMLDLSGAGIIDEVPSWLWSFSPSLDTLYLSHNQISGAIPDLSSTSIVRLDVVSNKFSGPIPLLHQNSHNIQLNQNMFFGSISSICRVPYPQLWFLGLSNNQLSGELPICWEKMPNLMSLDLANNSFVGTVPHSFGSLHDLYALQLRDNKLSGELPSTLSFCQELVLFDVGGNELTGEIPSWIGEIGLYYLNLGSNEFHGSIPPAICDLTYIQLLDIRMNNLSGKIPDCFSNFTMLADKNTSQTPYVFGFYYHVQYNPQLPNMYVKAYNEYSTVGWKGQESEYGENLNLLGLIDFSSNRLTGNIPESLSSMKGLRSLNLSRNSLSGNIIPDIGQMETLESLDLSKNQLSGEIPTSLAQLNFLSFIDLSNNNLSGRIPSGTQLQSFNASSYAGNDGLCGRPLTRLCPGDSPSPPSSTQGEEDDGFWGLSFMQGLGISIGFGLIVGFWGAVGSLVLKQSWRYAYFNLLNDVEDWFYVRISIFLSRKRLCCNTAVGEKLVDGNQHA